REVRNGSERLSGPLKTSSALLFRADLDGSSAKAASCRNRKYAWRRPPLRASCPKARALRSDSIICLQRRNVLQSRDDGRRHSGGRSLGYMGINQLAHARIPRGIGSFSEHHADQVPTVTTQRGDQVVTRRFGIAGLDAIDALHFPKQGIVIADLRAVILEAENCKIARVCGKPIWMARPSKACSRAVVTWASAGR